jgi:8-oxo-dGTP pyrophosphatase MutT (NUDIX family)
VRDHEVAIVVSRGLEFLVLLRAPDGGGYWHLPAGGVEEGETEVEAAVRELAEETGLRARVHDLGLALGYDAPGGRVHVGMYAVEAPSGWEPTLDDEHVEYRWCPEADALALLRYPEPRIALEHAARRMEGL